MTKIFCLPTSWNLICTYPDILLSLRPYLKKFKFGFKKFFSNNNDTRIHNKLDIAGNKQEIFDYFVFSWPRNDFYRPNLTDLGHSNRLHVPQQTGGNLHEKYDLELKFQSCFVKIVRTMPSSFPGTKYIWWCWISKSPVSRDGLFFVIKCGTRFSASSAQNTIFHT